jgi:hypothetical protein
MLNKVRMDAFDSLSRSLSRTGEPTREEAKAIANYVNVTTGRGTVGTHGGVSNAIAGLNSILFAPRLLLSRFQFLASPLTGFRYGGGSARTRKLFAREMGRLLSGLGVVYGLGALAGGKIETDWRSTDFGKIRFGDTRVDPLMGIQQLVVLIGRFATNEKKTAAGKIRPLDGSDKGPFGETFSDVAGRFVRSKLAPIP